MRRHGLLFAKVLLFVTAMLVSACGGKSDTAPEPEVPDITAAHRINPDTAAYHSAPAIAFNNAGIGVAVWVERVSGNARMLSAVYNNGWGAESVLLPSVAKDGQPVIASDGTDFMLVYSTDFAYAVRLDNQGKIVETRAFSNSNNPIFQKYPAVVSAGPGKYAVTWQQLDSSSRWRVYVSSYAAGTWSTPVPVSNTAGDVSAWEPFSMVSNGTEYGITWLQQDSTGPDTYEYNVYANISSSGTWTSASAVLVESGTGGAYDPRIASNGTDFAVAWQQQDSGGIWHVYANISASGTWTASNAVLVEQGTSHSMGPAIASKGSDFVVAWQQNDEGNLNIYANSSSSGAWDHSAAVLIENSDTETGRPRIASNGSNLAVVWQQMDSSVNGYRLFANVFSSLTGTTQDGALPVENFPGSAFDARLVPHGTEYAVVWQQRKSPSDNSIAANLHQGSWGEAADLVKGTYRDTSSQPVMAVNKNGVTLAAWMQYELNVLHVFGRIRNDGAWGPVFKISSTSAAGVDVATNGTGFMILFHEDFAVKARTCTADGALGSVSVLGGDSAASEYAGSGRVVSNGSGYGAAWVLTKGATGSMYAGVYNETTGWGTAALLESANRSASNPAIVSDGTGYVVVWEQADGTGSKSIYGNVWNGSAWSGDNLLETGGGQAGAPRVASNGTGYAVAWHQNDGTTYSIYANLFSSLTASTRDSALLVENGSGVAYNPVIASNGTGYAIAWHQDDSAVSRTRAYANVFSSLTATTKDAAVSIDAPGTGTVFAAQYPAIASNGTGYAVAWTQNTGTSEQESIYANVLDGSEWTGPTMLETGEGRATGAFITSSGSRYSAIWSQQDETDAFVWDIWVKTGL